jgi:hypothetical protein
MTMVSTERTTKGLEVMHMCRTLSGGARENRGNTSENLSGSVGVGVSGSSVRQNRGVDENGI